MLSTNFLIVALLGAADVIAYVPRAVAASSKKCDADNCYRAVIQTPSVGSSFCGIYLQPTTVITITPTVTISGTATIRPSPPTSISAQVIPSHFSQQCVTTSSGLPARLSSVCSCLAITAKSTVTSTAVAAAKTTTISTIATTSKSSSSSSRSTSSIPSSSSSRSTSSTTSTSSKSSLSSTTSTPSKSSSSLSTSTSSSSLSTSVSSSVSSSVCVTITATNTFTSTSYNDLDTTTSQYSTVVSTTTYTVNTTVYGTVIETAAASIDTATVEDIEAATIGTTSISTSILEIFPTTTEVDTATTTVYAESTSTAFTIQPAKRENIAGQAPSGCTVTVSTQITVGTVSATGYTASTILVSTSYASAYVTQTISAISTVYTTPISTVSTTITSVSTTISTEIDYATISLTGNAITETSTAVATAIVTSSPAIATVPVSSFIVQAHNSRTGANYYFAASTNSLITYATTLASAAIFQFDANTGYTSLISNTDQIIYVRPGTYQPAANNIAFMYSATDTSNLAAHSALLCTIDPITFAMSCQNQQNVAQTFYHSSSTTVLTCASQFASLANVGQNTVVSLTAIPVV